MRSESSLHDHQRIEVSLTLNRKIKKRTKKERKEEKILFSTCMNPAGAS